MPIFLHGCNDFLDAFVVHSDAYWASISVRTAVSYPVFADCKCGGEVSRMCPRAAAGGPCGEFVRPAARRGFLRNASPFGREPSKIIAPGGAFFPLSYGRGIGIGGMRCHFLGQFAVASCLFCFLWYIAEILFGDFPTLLHVGARGDGFNCRPVIATSWPAGRLYHLMRDLADAAINARRGVSIHVVLIFFLHYFFWRREFINLAENDVRWGYLA